MNADLIKILKKYDGHVRNQDLIAKIRKDVWAFLSNPFLKTEILSPFTEFDIFITLGTTLEQTILQSFNPDLNRAIQKFLYEEKEDVVIGCTTFIREVKFAPDVILKIGGTPFKCSCKANVFKRILNPLEEYSIFKCKACGMLYEGR